MLAKEKKGITLIALVITIIILLILAGITLSALMGENGLIENTKTFYILVIFMLEHMEKN